MGGGGGRGENYTKSCGKGKEKVCREPGLGGSREEFALYIRAGGSLAKEPGGRKKGSQLCPSTCGGLVPHTEADQEARRDR